MARFSSSSKQYGLISPAIPIPSWKSAMKDTRGLSSRVFQICQLQQNLLVLLAQLRFERSVSLPDTLEFRLPAEPCVQGLHVVLHHVAALSATHHITMLTQCLVDE